MANALLSTGVNSARYLMRDAWAGVNCEQRDSFADADDPTHWLGLRRNSLAYLLYIAKKCPGSSHKSLRRQVLTYLKRQIRRYLIRRSWHLTHSTNGGATRRANPSIS